VRRRALTIDHRSAPEIDFSEQETKVINYDYRLARAPCSVSREP